MKIILASSSPRRRELLEKAGFSFEIISADIDETPVPGQSPEEMVESLARKKVSRVCECLPQLSAEGAEIIIGADTVVAVDGLILGKPRCDIEAFNMLSRLSGRCHTVHTGVALAKRIESRSDPEINSFVESTKVFFRRLSCEEIHAYIATGEPFDKAGAYGIQERGSTLIERVEGDFFAVMGLPVCRLYLEMKRLDAL